MQRLMRVLGAGERGALDPMTRNDSGGARGPRRARFALEAWAGRLAAWVNDEERSLFGLLAALTAAWSIDAAIELFRDPQVLLIVVACPLAALLLWRLDARLPSLSAAPAGRLSTLAAFVFMLVIWRVAVTLWLRADGFFGIQETGKSAAIYLSSHQVRDIVSFFLQEHAASPDPAAQGYYYLHHPNFISRLFTMLGIALGMSQELIILACLALSALSLFLAFLALRRLFGPGIALAAAGFFATSYGVYFRQGGDLLRGLHAVMFWLLLYLTALERDAPLRRTLGLNLALAALFVFMASSDWAFFTFCFAFYLLWDAYSRGKLASRHFLAWVVLPSAMTFVAYFAVGIAYTSPQFFLTDMLVSYFGRMGNVLAGPLLGQNWDPAKFLAMYRAQHIVVWDTNPAPAGMAEAVASYWRAMRAGGPLVAWLLAASFIGCCATTLFRIAKDRMVRGAVLALFAGIVLGAVPLAWVLLLLPYLAFGLRGLRAQSPAGRRGGVIEPLPLLQDLAAWIAVVLSAVTVVAALFPNYVFWLWDRGVSPVGLADAVGFALICRLLAWPIGSTEVGAWLRARFMLAGSLVAHVARSRSGPRLPGARLWQGLEEVPAAPAERPWPAVQHLAVAAICGLALLHLIASFELYRALPPRGPSYASTLRKAEFHGKFFVANTYDGLVWYFTRGPSMITTVVPPDRESTERFRHFRDGDDEAKYSHPEYFLCDNDPYFSFQRVGRINGELCQMPTECTCLDIMRIMVKEGNTPVVVGPDFVIMKYNYAK